jgi:hypothetical protein
LIALHGMQQTVGFCRHLWPGSPSRTTGRAESNFRFRCYRTPELPTYLRLGLAREAAMTQVQIADFLAYRGERDEALRILREMALPTFKRLGDARLSAAVEQRIDAYTPNSERE